MKRRILAALLASLVLMSSAACASDTEDPAVEGEVVIIPGVKEDD